MSIEDGNGISTKDIIIDIWKRIDKLGSQVEAFENKFDRYVEDTNNKINEVNTRVNNLSNSMDAEKKIRDVIQTKNNNQMNRNNSRYALMGTLASATIALFAILTSFHVF